MKFHEPTDVVVGKNSRIYVLDGVNHRVQVFESNGNFLFKFGEFGSDEGSLNMPMGLGADRAGNIYVADTRNHRVQVFDSNGKYLKKIELPRKKGDEALPDPTDVLVVSPPDEDEKIWITDNDNHRIHIFDKDTLKLETTVGRHGFDEEGKFRYPHNMTVDSSYNVYVVDVLNTRVQVFTRAGKFLREIGEWGIKEGTFFRPKGVAVDAHDRVYVSDGYMGVVQVFTKDGEYVGVIAKDKNKELKFNVPISIYIDGTNRLYVVQELGHKLSVFKLP
ncbi:MAG: NHL repeat-containing protein [Candidatus Schekmanbacteria bacterium]|nr:NHL repeat-containing protein [Candidatus Schekmanbacteria bacterium]